MSQAPGSPRPSPGDTRSHVSGQASEVVQARDVSGGIHFHYGTGSRSARPRQLPRGLRVFVNRASDLAALDQILEGEAAPTVAYVIAGTAGVGKTSLALHWAHRVSDRFPDGQLYVDMRGYDPGTPLTADQALEFFLPSLGVPGSAVPADTESKATLYRSLLAERRMLVVVDNAATVGQVRPLLPGSGTSLVLVTSRSRLSGLMVRDGAHRENLEILPEAESVALLSATMSGYRLADSAEDLAELARLCAHLPLALRVAAERAASRPSMPLADLITDLRDESSLWDALSTDDEDEASAVRSVFAWSYRALPRQAALLFCLLGLHPGAEFGAAAAEALAGDALGVSEAGRLRTALDTLTGAYLLEEGGAGRYRFHDLLRAYAVDRARYETSQEEQLAAVARVCTWYLHSAHSCAAVLAHDTSLLPPLDTPEGVVPATFADRKVAAAWYAEERENLLGAMTAAEGTGLTELVIRFATVLERLHSTFNHFRDWRVSARTGLRAARERVDLVSEAGMRESLGRLERMTMRLDEAAEHHRAATEIHLELGDTLSAAKSRNGSGWIHLFAHRLDEAHAELTEALAEAEEAGDTYWIATVRYSLGYTCAQSLRSQEADRHLNAALAGFRELSDPLYESLVLTARSLVELNQQNVSSALAHAERAVEIARSVENVLWEGTALLYLGRALRAADRAEEALECYQRAMLVFRREGDASREAIAVGGAGSAYLLLGRYAEAADFHRRSVAVHRNLSDHWKVAKGLLYLAQALEGRDGEEAREEAARYRAEALEILGGHDDPKSSELSERARAATAPEGGA